MISMLSLIHRILNAGISLYEIALLVYFLLSWIPNARGTTLWNILQSICEPYVGFFRQFIPPLGGISFAGLIALFVLSFVQRGIDVIFIYLVRFFL